MEIGGAMLIGGALFPGFAMDVKRGRKFSKFSIMSKGEIVSWFFSGELDVLPFMQTLMVKRNGTLAGFHQIVLFCYANVYKGIHAMCHLIDCNTIIIII